VLNGSTGASVASDSTGYNYGSDSTSQNAPCGSPPYTEPVGTCSTTDGKYGLYAGIDGAWNSWQGCGSYPKSWANFQSSRYSDADYNATVYGIGAGGSVLWLGAGEGRDPNYNGSDANANAWGQAQAQRIVSDVQNNGLFNHLSMIWMDMEQDYSEDGAPYDTNGWDTRWSSVCSNSSVATSVPGNLNWDVFDTFRNYIVNYTTYRAGVYAGGGSSGWAEIMSPYSYTLNNTMEWTFTGSAGGSLTSSDFPQGWSGDGQSASWFANVASNCEGVWQWYGGGGAYDPYNTDLDQENTGNMTGSCA
jgi:hypothetical protein